MAKHAKGTVAEGSNPTVNEVLTAIRKDAEEAGTIVDSASSTRDEKIAAGKRITSCGVAIEGIERAMRLFNSISSQQTLTGGSR